MKVKLRKPYLQQQYIDKIFQRQAGMIPKNMKRLKPVRIARLFPAKTMLHALL